MSLKIKMKYFTPPTTFENLWMEFHQSVGHVKNLLLDFIMALSNILKAVAAILNILCEVIELLIHFGLTIVNEIWLVLKIVLVMGETIRALGPEEPSKVQKNIPDYIRKHTANPEIRNRVTSLNNLRNKDTVHPAFSRTIKPGSSRKDFHQSYNSGKDSHQSYNSGKDSHQSYNSGKDSHQSYNSGKDSHQSYNSGKVSNLSKNSENELHLSHNNGKDSLQFDPDRKESNKHQKDSKLEETKRQAQHNLLGLYAPPIYIGHTSNIRYLNPK
ncbi:hypothetical protein GDO81_003271 [Engystomops pustulosus]|uniref:Uncharacterized protein n=1 Tax=Engystomops pustulosus TaxID=76066 RepID=A0AAV7A2G2_ENGPU|nr:hypothetical protein GDO81_003271 [Engystomops pustulosus]KAG8553102.1 hypothetical protein GDO81_003271 [Engystomops pustulosus]